MKTLFVVLVMLAAILVGNNAYAHSGRTDSWGGHHNWKSGYGSYHYHNSGWRF